MKIKKINLNENKRWIMMSDIHGNYDAFIKLLEDVKYTQQDILILIGDITSKGPQSLKTLRYIYELSKTHEIYCLMGNCDVIALMVKDDKELEDLREYLFYVPNLVTEMCKEANIEVSLTVDMAYLCEKVTKTYPELFDFLDSFLDVLETSTHIFTHAGYDPSRAIVDERDSFLRYGNGTFLLDDVYCEKTMVVGHMPSMGYGGEVYNCNPIFDEKNHRISIDGGNIIKKYGQLNALIYEHHQYRTVYVDVFTKQCEVIQDQSSRYGFAAAYHLKELIWVDQAKELVESLVYQQQGYSLGTYYIKDQLVGDATNSYLELIKGELVYLLKEYDEAYLIKKEGLVGLAHKQNLKIV